MITPTSRMQPENARSEADDRNRFRNQPTRDEVARRAYEFYERRGAEPGHDVDDWLQAECELEQRYAK